MSVVGNYLIVGSKKIKIYKTNTDGTITLDPKLIVLYNAFKSPINIIPQLCEDSSYMLPSNNIVSFKGSIDVLSGFIFFTRYPPIQVDTPIINEGIALDIYFSGVGRYPGVRFEYEGSSDINEIRIYCLLPGTDNISLITDYSGNITRYFNRKGSVDIPNAGFIYFKTYPSSTITTLDIRCKSIKPYPPTCIPIPKQTCLDPYRIPVTKSSEIDIINYNIIPCPQWRSVADLISSTFITTQLPIPLTPIIPPTLRSIISYTIICDARNLSGGQPGSPIEMNNVDTVFWSQYGTISNGGIPLSIEENGVIQFVTTLPLIWATNGTASSTYWSVAPVAEVNGVLQANPGINGVSVVINLFVDTTEHPADAELSIVASKGTFYNPEYYSINISGLWQGSADPTHYVLKKQMLNGTVYDINLILLPETIKVTGARFTMNVIYDI